MNQRVGAAISLVMFAFANPVIAGEDDWVGLYKGLDILDGSIDYLSISQKDAVTYELRVVPSVISLCPTGQGWIVAEGVLQDDGSMLRQNGQVFCAGEEPAEVPDRLLTRDPETGIIKYGATDDSRPLIYHKVSSD